LKVQHKFSDYNVPFDSTNSALSFDIVFSIFRFGGRGAGPQKGEIGP
jgi:hypothetical protein